MLWICWDPWWVITKCLDYLTHENESIIKENDYYNDVWMLVKILICKLNKLISHIFNSVFSSAKASSHVHKGIINIFKSWSFIKEWALAKTKFGKHLPLALHSLFYFQSIPQTLTVLLLHFSKVFHRLPEFEPLFSCSFQPMQRC